MIAGVPITPTAISPMGRLFMLAVARLTNSSDGNNT